MKKFIMMALVLFLPVFCPTFEELLNPAGLDFERLKIDQVRQGIMRSIVWEEAAKNLESQIAEEEKGRMMLRKRCGSRFYSDVVVPDPKYLTALQTALQLSILKGLSRVSCDIPEWRHASGVVEEIQAFDCSTSEELTAFVKIVLKELASDTSKFWSPELDEYDTKRFTIALIENYEKLTTPVRTRTIDIEGAVKQLSLLISRTPEEGALIDEKLHAITVQLFTAEILSRNMKTIESPDQVSTLDLPQKLHGSTLHNIMLDIEKRIKACDPEWKILYANALASLQNNIISSVESLIAS